LADFLGVSPLLLFFLPPFARGDTVNKLDVILFGRYPPRPKQIIAVRHLCIDPVQFCSERQVNAKPNSLSISTGKEVPGDCEKNPQHTFARQSRLPRCCVLLLSVSLLPTALRGGQASAKLKLAISFRDRETVPTSGSVVIIRRKIEIH